MFIATSKIKITTTIIILIIITIICKHSCHYYLTIFVITIVTIYFRDIILKPVSTSFKPVKQISRIFYCKWYIYFLEPINLQNNQWKDSTVAYNYYQYIMKTRAGYQSKTHLKSTITKPVKDKSGPQLYLNVMIFASLAQI